MTTTSRLSDAQVAAFAKLRDKMRFEHAGHHHADSKLNALFSAATLSRLLKSESDYPSESFSPAVRERLIWAYREADDHGVYGGIEALIGQSEIGRRIIQDNFCGDFSLFRFERKLPTYHHTSILNDEFERFPSPDLELIEERISIEFDRHNEPEFKYWAKDNQSEEHDLYGAVFYSLGKLFLTGTARDTIALGILHVSRIDEPMHGFWTSTSNSGMRAPYSARVLLVNRKSDSVISSLKSIDGPDIFFKITDGSYAFYMTVA
jgi:hypothetical protein